ncbi:MAG: diguanylate cyclase [bacterium]|nr:diguanylate cyclase [bacterium]
MTDRSIEASIVKPFYIIKKQGVYLFLAWTLIAFSSLAINLYINHKTTINAAADTARTHYEINITYRLLIADLGGVYGLTDNVAPNPHLLVPNRDIITINGEHLTLINPAYFTRMVFDKIKASSPLPLLNRITSLKPLNPNNKPDEWEKEGLLAFEKGQKEVAEITKIYDEPYFRLMKPFITEQSCLKCHEKQGYKIGDIRGGISIAVPLKPFYENESKERTIIIITHLLLWFLVSGSIFAFTNISAKNAETYEQTKDMSLHDHLTGLANRRLMEIELEIFFAKAKRYNNKLSAIMLDIDHFKKFNDTYGHEAGDKALSIIAEIIEMEVRETDLAIRYGGEEFLILLPQTGLTETIEAAERIKKAVNLQTKYTVSLGVSTYNKDMQQKEDIIKKADDALYLAKNKGRNRIEVIT